MDKREPAPPSGSDSGLYRPHMGVENPRSDNFVQAEGIQRFDQCEPIHEMDGLELTGAPAVGVVDGDENAPTAAAGMAAVPEVKLQVVEKSIGKRKRGRPSRGQVKTPPKKRKDEEDVCFICFDGGTLVLCDRRSCPKAYHPACIKRDEAFFRSKARWNCGWHICSICEKAAHYTCYTCTYSLCKVCISEAEILCVRGNQGFCTTCMRTVMLIENIVQGDKETVQVDFDDKNNWEYLFKLYWLYLKGKLSLSLDELTKAKNPSKGIGVLSCRGDYSGEPYNASNNNSSTSDGSFRNMVKNSSKRKIGKQPKFPNKIAQYVVEAGVDGRASLREDAQWASKELLEFVGHMKNGETSILCQFDVQVLLLEYIERNNLRDPHHKRQIICDLRLGKLFGKACLGHLEMLKLLELHFLIKDDSRVDCMRQGYVDVTTGQVVADRNNDNQPPTISKDERHITHKRGDNKGQRTNLDEYAAINVHNINLIYLRRSLMEILIEDAGKFSENVVGAVVRIRISTFDQKQDMYRLVQVAGTCKAAVPYKVGERTTDVMLEILNLDKIEAISIDAISNQEFSEDECRRLRKSTKAGLAKCLTVGELQEKAMALREVKLTDCRELEILRLSHLHDQASENWHRKELRECVEKLELSNTPEERRHRLHDVPEVHSDPDLYSMSVISSNERELISPWGGSDVSNNTRTGLQKTCEPNKNTPHAKLVSEAHGRENEVLWNQGRNAHKSNNWGEDEKPVDLSDPATVGWNKQHELSSGPSPVVALETLISILSAEIASSVNSIDTDKIWHYQDHNGDIHGPFSMVQLRKWSTNGCFPPDLRIWRMSETQDDSVLLGDALHGIYHKEQPLLYDSYLQLQEVGVASDDGENNWEGRGEDTNLNLIDSRKNKGADWNDAVPYPNCDGEFLGGDEHSSHSSWNMPAGFANLKEKQTGSSSHCCDLLGANNSWSDQSQMHCSLPSPTLLGKPCETVLHQGGDGHESKAQDSCQGHENQNSRESQTNREQNNERRSDNCDHSGQSSGQNWKPSPLCSSSNGWALTPTVAKSSETLEQQHESDFPDLPSPVLRQSDVGLKGQIDGNRPFVASTTSVPDSGPSGSSASSLVGGGAQHPEVAVEWGGDSPNSGKPSVEEWDSALLSASLLRPSEAADDHAATPTSNTGQLTHSSASHPASDTSNWQVIVSGTGTNEFSSLGEKSVSDLLAEIDAMELDGLHSPTSIMNCGEEFAQGSKNDCFSSLEVLSPALEPGKSDALSSTGDLQLAFKSSMMDEPEPQVSSCVDVLNARKRSSGPFASVEAEGETNRSGASVTRWETGSGVEPHAPTKSGKTVANTASRAHREIAENGLGQVHKNANLGCDGGHSKTACGGWGPIQGNTNLGSGKTTDENSNVGQGTVLGMARAAMESPAVNLSVRGSQAKYTGGRESYPRARDRGLQGRDSSFVKNRPAWNRQSLLGGGGSSRPLSKVQRVCKFYERGYCRKGAFCDYLHP